MRRLILLTVAVLLALPAATASADSRLESMFQDDPRILSTDVEVRDKTLDELQALGVQRVRVTAFWNRIAPEIDEPVKPAGFDGSNPNAYPAASWTILDGVVDAIAARGMKIDLNPTAPMPKWAGSGAPEARLASVSNPSPAEFGAFVAALGTRYSGSFVPAGRKAPLPRLSYWTLWNEPNQGVWLSPQWKAIGKQPVEASPELYRGLVDAAWTSLGATGHGNDTILIGETAPKGVHPASKLKAVSDSMPPLRFLRRLYCLDDQLAFLTGPAATAVGCPATPDAAAFVAAHPGLFGMTGYAHHPYELTLSPTTSSGAPDYFVTMANIASLGDQLDRVMGRYGQQRRTVPLYLTDYGYQSNPPDPQAPSLTAQAVWMNQGEYLAWKNPQVRTLSQFLLYDDAPIAGVKDEDSRWGTFQSGLRFGPGSKREGQAKPALDAYRLAFFVPRRTLGKSRRLPLWAHVRPGKGKRQVELQIQTGKGRFKRVRRLTTDRHGFLSQSVVVRRSGVARLSWKAGSKRFVSRSVSFRVKRR